MGKTRLDYTGQKLDDTGLLYYNVQYRDPELAKFVLPDSIMPEASSIKMKPNHVPVKTVSPGVAGHTDAQLRES